ncbi:MAG: response regulator [Verrucomicrobiota bacterium]
MSTPPPLIAVVDDDAPVRTSLSRLLRSSGYAVATFESGDAFLEGMDPRSRAPLPDCLVLDLHMPGRHGFEVCAALKTTHPKLPIILITGKEEPDTADQVREAGAGTFLTKPFDESELLAAVCGSLPVPPAPAIS